MGGWGQTYRDGAARVQPRGALLTAPGPLFAASPCRGRCRASIHMAADLMLHTARSVTVTTGRQRDQGEWGGTGWGRKRRARPVCIVHVCRVKISEGRGQARTGERESSVRGSLDPHTPQLRPTPPPSSAQLHARSPQRSTPPPCGSSYLPEGHVTCEWDRGTVGQRAASLTYSAGTLMKTDLVRSSWQRQKWMLGVWKVGGGRRSWVLHSVCSQRHSQVSTARPPRSASPHTLTEDRVQSERTR